jgi:transcriptional regulator with XRE-family HTH domain
MYGLQNIRITESGQMVARDSLDPDSSLWDWIAVDLRFWRLKFGMSQEEVGRIIHVNRHTVSNLEAGRYGYRLNSDQALALDTTWDLNFHFTRLVKYAKAGHDPNWFLQHVRYEVRASMMRTYEPLLIPGLLQTEAYIRALLAGIQAVKDMDAAVETRLDRQKILTKEDPPLFRAILDYAALDRLVGGPKVMKEQLGWLLEISELPNVVVRAVTKSAGSYPGLEGPFLITTVAEGEVAYMEACGGGRLTVDKAEVRGYGHAYDRISDVALPIDTSRDFIASIMESM